MIDFQLSTWMWDIHIFGSTRIIISILSYEKYHIILVLQEFATLHLKQGSRALHKPYITFQSNTMPHLLM